MAHIAINGNMRKVQWGSFPYGNDVLSIVKQNVAALEEGALKGVKERIDCAPLALFERHGRQVAVPPPKGDIEEFKRTSYSGVDPVGMQPDKQPTNYEVARGRAVTVNADSSVSFYRMTPEELIKHGKGHR